MSKLRRPCNALSYGQFHGSLRQRLLSSSSCAQVHMHKALILDPGSRPWHRCQQLQSCMLAWPRTPKRVADDEEGYVRRVCAPQDVLRRALHHLPVRHYHLLSIKGLLQPGVSVFRRWVTQCVLTDGIEVLELSSCVTSKAFLSVPTLARDSDSALRWVPCWLVQQELHQYLAHAAGLMAAAHQSLLGHEQDRRVRLQVHALAPLDDLQAPALAVR